MVTSLYLMYIKVVGDVLFSSRGRLRGSPPDPRSVRFLTRRPLVPLLFLTCNISQFSPIPSRPVYSLQECFRHFVEARPPPWGGLVSEVAFGGVSNSLGTDRLGGARAKPVTYRLTEEKNRLTRNEATIRPEQAHAWSVASVLF
jgi:hypothetical protein